MKYIFATGNPGKIKEIRAIFEEVNEKVFFPEDFGFTYDPTETGNTFIENATEKAVNCAAFVEAKDICVLADDSGLLIDILDGKPGVYSARWLGEDTPYTEKNRKILDMLVNVPDEKRTARFVCVIAASLPDKRILTKEAAVEGRIAHEAKGENGFGYDPIFYLPEYGRTSAELRPEEKNRISHRGRALRAMLAMLKNI